MRHCLPLAVLAVACGSAPAQEPPRTDRHGDPLPAGAIARLGTLRLRHQGMSTSALVFSPDGKILASAGEYGPAARLWDVATGKELRRLQAESVDPAAVVAFSPDGTLLATGALFGGPPDNVQLWGVTTGRLLRTFKGHDGEVFAVTFADGDKTLVTAGKDGKVRWWDRATGKQTREWAPGELGRQAAAFESARLAPGGKVLVASVTWAGQGQDGRGARGPGTTFAAWDLATGKELWQIGEREDFCGLFTFSPDGRLAALPAGMAAVSVRDAVTGKERQRLQGNGIVFCCAFTADGNTLAVAHGEDGRTRTPEGVSLWDVATGKLVRDLVTPSPGRFGPQHFALAPDGKALVIESDRVLSVCDTVTGKRHHAWEGHNLPVAYVAFAADGKQLVSGGSFNNAPAEAVTWDAGTWRESSRRELPSAFLPTLSPDLRIGVRFTSTGWQIYDCTTKKAVAKLAMPNKDVRLDNMLIPPGNRFVLAVAGEGNESKVWLFDAASGKHLGDLPVEALEQFGAVAPDGTALAYYSAARTVHVIDTATGKRRWELRAGRDGWKNANNRAVAVAFAPDGRTLASWDNVDDNIHLWDLATGKELLQLPGRRSTRRFGWPVCLAFSRDGRLLAVGEMAGEHTVEVWELATGKVRHDWVGHLDTVMAVAFAPDGRYLASGSEDTTVLVWDLWGSPRHTPQTEAAVAACWADLATADAPRAAEAVAALAAAPGLAVPYLARHLPPAAAPAAARLRQLLADLDAPAFADRDRATRALADLEDLAAPALRQALAGKPSLELRRRVEQLLAAVQDGAVTGPALLRGLRAVEVLERVGDAEARRVLAALAGGAAEARLTRTARAALDRLVGTPFFHE